MAGRDQVSVEAVPLNGYLLDTSVIIDWLRGYPTAVGWLRTQIERGSNLVLSPITVLEVMAGTRPSARLELRRRLTAFPTEAIDFETAALAGEMLFDLRSQGRPTGMADRLVAAQARLLGLTVATSNPAHFPEAAVVGPRQHRP